MKFNFLFQSKNKNQQVKSVSKELERIQQLPQDVSGSTTIFGNPFRFHHAASFAVTYKELFQDELYKFNPAISENGVILDCGANMGLSVLYFSLHYPNHQIIAFEPDETIFEILQENVRNFNLSNVTLHRKAVWTEEAELTFHSDGGMGGTIDHIYQDTNESITKVNAVPLADWLTDKVDFLKIDIEGAEYEVLESCQKLLGNASHIFFEYHNDINKPQTLHILLEMIETAGFRYHLKESSTRRRPFVDDSLICERFDMAITVFCYK
ncbi:FkbM family methyltransferase [Algoriphagus sp. Y33]|uniref:FkbM family methyltransferase n=1 Tax=Algoriphagus sp. Y33 TaxID=2772483 RepID=UPI00177E389F|nr:FkbM family methyltransferase [Algoriphagus sp. Y33]